VRKGFFNSLLAGFKKVMLKTFAGMLRTHHQVQGKGLIAVETGQGNGVAFMAQCANRSNMVLISMAAPLCGSRAHGVSNSLPALKNSKVRWLP